MMLICIFLLLLFLNVYMKLSYLPAVSKWAEMFIFIDSAKFKIALSSRIQNVIVVFSPILYFSNSSGLEKRKEIHVIYIKIFKKKSPKHSLDCNLRTHKSIIDVCAISVILHNNILFGGFD